MTDTVYRRLDALEALNSGISAAELGFLDGVVAGTAAASKALVLNSSSGITTGLTLLTATTVTATTLNATTTNGTTHNVGASGTAGTLNVFPTTASKGKLALTVTDQSTDTTVSLVIGAMAAARTITLNDPGATASLLTSTGVGATQVVRQSADVVKDDGAAASALTGLVHTLLVGTYKYKAMIQCLSTANGGAKITFALTTAVLSSIQNVGRAFTTAAVATARSTTATSGATLYGATAAIVQVELEGTFVVTTGGTIQLQGEQNASHADESTFYTGSTFEITRIA